MMAIQKHRLITRSDFDGLVCAILLRELDLIDDIKFVHPKDMQDGIVPTTARDIITNLPHVVGKSILERAVRPLMLARSAWSTAVAAILLRERARLRMTKLRP
jgi:hypothetical protein